MKRLGVIIILVVLLGILPSLLAYGGFYYWGDFLTQQIPYILETKRMLSSGVPLWSWNTMYGDSFIGAYSFYTLTSPFVWINCLFPYELVDESIVLTLLLKFLCLGFASYAYLRKMDVSKESSRLGALMYAFSSFAISNLFYYHFMEPMFVFPIYLFAIEKYMRRERWGNTWLAGITFLVAFINFYFLPCSVLSGLVYALCRMRSDDVQMGWKRVFLAAILSLLGLCLAMFVLLPTYLQLAGGPRDSINFYYYPAGIRERFRSLFMPKLSERETALFWIRQCWQSNEANIPVFGMFLAIVYCVRRRFKSWLTWVLLVFVVLYVSPLNAVFSLFTNNDYSRWAYALTLIIVLATVKIIDEKQQVRLRYGWFYAAFCLLLCGGMLIMGVLHRQRHPEDFIEVGWQQRLCFVGGLLILSLVLLIVYLKWQRVKVAMWCVAVFATAHFVSFTQFHNMLPYGVEGQKQLVKRYAGIGDAGDKTFHHRTVFCSDYTNCPLLFGKPGVCLSGSVRNNNIRRLMWAVDSLRLPTRFVGPNFIPKMNLESYYSLLSVKEVMEFDGIAVEKPLPHDNLVMREKENGIIVYDYRHYIPMGFCYDSFVDEALVDTAMRHKPMPDIPRQMLSALSVGKNGLAVARQYMTEGRVDIPVEACLDSLVRERSKVCCTSFEGDSRGFRASIDMPKANLVFFSVPCDAGFTAFVDGKETTIYEVNLGLSAVEVPQGTHVIEFRFVPQGLLEGCAVSLAALFLFLAVALMDKRKPRNGGG